MLAYDTTPALPDVSIIIVAYGDQPLLERSVASCLQSANVNIEVILVDNGCTDGAIETFRDDPRIKIIEPSRNIGFTGGCHIGRSHATAPFMMLLNPDAIVEKNAVTELRRVATRVDVGVTTASLRLHNDPENINAAGNDVHFLGLSWCRGFGQHFSNYSVEEEVIAASGAAMMIRCEVWDRLSGFAENFFAYYEDVEFSIRVWQSGLSVIFVPTAIVYHDYQFSANKSKLWLLDRNRILTLLTVYEWRTIIALAPLLFLQEIGFIGVSASQGWFKDRVRSIWLIMRDLRALHQRRKVILDHRSKSDASYIWRFATTVAPGNYSLPKLLIWTQAPLRIYWQLVMRLLRCKPS